ncbi:DUF2332 domain-containing protein [Actinoallomurus iriomotensis]|uniref:DUF2332 domain-containing protein n=1 Tax=Actinoallomurus iriomotensis TaxID=478107 RepID=A0A9W6RDX7_9ACTN|nr:DUF2332 domain-containing protein [Actinoallomurus iriomotensis]GLY74251.1 hypothetical protein Airi01_025180 [Actinoallomurus iriomotensis]
MAEGPGDPAGDRDIEVRRLRRLFRIFGATQCRGRSPVYEALSEGVADDDGLLDLLMATPRDQRRPSLLFAAVNLLLASDPGSALAGYYPVHGGRRPVDDRLMPAFAAFCAEHRDELGRLLRTGSTQTNEIRRCVALRLGLDHVRRRWPGPLALVEAGASAGLNLLVDRYRYRVGGQEASVSDASPVLITCEVRGGSPHERILGPVPEITSRRGIDRHPVDLADPGARAWLEAFVWPERLDDLAVLRGAMDLAVSSATVTVAPGDATTDTARLIGELPGREPVVVFTASLLSYLDFDARTAFAAQLRQAAARRPVAWVFAEAPGLVATTDGLIVPEGSLARRNSRYLIGASLRGSGQRDDALLALADPYLRWLAPARHRTDDFAWLPADADTG